MRLRSIDVDTGFRPHVYQRKAKELLNRKRFVVLVCHRRWGKTVFAVMDVGIEGAYTDKKDFRGAYIAPFRKQAKDVSWDIFKRYFSKMPGMVFNETELTASFPNGSKVTLYGADNADAMRGLYFDYVIMDEVADMKPNVWGEIVRPTLIDRKGKCLFIGTPKGANILFDLYNRGAAEAEDGPWASLMFRAEEDSLGVLPWITEEELAEARRDMTAAQYRQEMECDFQASNENVLITLDAIYKARGKHIPEDDYKYAPLIFGVDVARYGGDACVIQARKGLAAFPPERITDIDNMTFASHLHRRILKEKPDAVFIDSGRGEGVIDRLRQLGDVVFEIPFGGKAHDGTVNGYANRRAEMWDTMRKWIEDGGAIPNDPELVKELAAVTYAYDGQSRLKLESKETIRERVGFSPDRADALALTFAEPVVSANDPMYRSGGYASMYARDELTF